MRKFQTIAIAATLGLSLTVAPAAQAKAKPKAFNGKTCTIVGTSKSEKLTGTSNADVICGLGGNDTINGLGGNDTIDGGNGNDILSGGENNDAIDGGNGNDTINGGNGNDSLTGDSGNDSLLGGAGNDALQGETGADVFSGGTGTDTAKYSEKTTGLTIDVDSNADDGATGEKDNIKTDVENITGGSGNDTITGSSAANTIIGGSGNDTINGGDGDDFIEAGPGSDRVTGGDGDDGLIGGTGRDALNGDGSTPDDIERNLCDPVADGDVALYCGFDESPPAITSVTLSRAIVDSSQSIQTIVISVQVSDELMGVSSLDCNLLFNGRSVGANRATSLNSGTIRNGTWRCTVSIKKWSAAGKYFVYLAASDYTGKTVELSGQSDDTYTVSYGQSIESHSLGDTFVNQIGAGDYNAPEIQQITVSKNFLNTSSANQNVKIRAYVTDDLSGNGDVFCDLMKDSILHQGDAKLISGTSYGGVWECDVTLPRWSSMGKWMILFSAIDRSGWQTAVVGESDGTFRVNRSTELDEVETGLGAAYINQIGKGDEKSPMLDQIQLSKRTVNTSSNSATVRISVKVTDDLSGVSFIGCGFRNLNSSGLSYSDGKLVSGTLSNGVWNCDATLPRGSAKGVWFVNLVAGDKSGRQTAADGQTDDSFWLSIDDGVSVQGDSFITNG